MSSPPSIVNGPRLVITKAVELDMPCPKCAKEIRVTSIEEGTVIKCPHAKCGNVTWRPVYVPPWWARTKAFTWSLLGAFALGIISSLVASFIYEKYTDARKLVTEDKSPTAVINP